MRIPRLYIDLPITSGEMLSLPKDKAHYISHVLRMSNGAPLRLFNNTGDEFKAIIVSLAKKHVEIDVKEKIKINNESALEITLCLAVSRGQHMDYSVQKSVELGVKEIIPVISEFSNVKLHADRLENKINHWRNIIISAAEQCGRNILPVLHEPISFNECLSLKTPSPKLILQPGTKRSMNDIKLEGNQLSILIGPEGGFSETEINESKERETISINMGPRILRAETAVVSALSNAQQLWGDLK